MQSNSTKQLIIELSKKIARTSSILAAWWAIIYWAIWTKIMRVERDNPNHTTNTNIMDANWAKSTNY